MEVLFSPQRTLGPWPLIVLSSGALVFSALSNIFGWRTRLVFVGCWLVLYLFCVAVYDPQADSRAFPSGRISTERERGSVFWLIVFLVLAGGMVAYRLAEISYTRALTIPLLFATTMGFFMLFRFLLGFVAIKNDRPAEIELSEAQLPAYAICVPCFNEGAQIEETLLSMEFDYPLDRYEVIVVDDGSTDDSPQHIMKACAELTVRGVRHRALLNKVNRGKRAVMADAIKVADAEFVVLVDSDSILEPGGLRRFLKYFADSQVAGVSAHADVLNQDEGPVARMQVVRYYVAFRVLKASESLFGTVTCCSGCCSAYRRSVLMQFLDEWLGQTFMGQPCTYSDDRALTNSILELGYDTKYAPDVRSWTVVPTTLIKFFRQQLRWKRGWLINSVLAGRFMWKRHPIAAFNYYAGFVFAFLSVIAVAVTLYWGFATDGWLRLTFGFLILLLSSLLYGAVYSLFRRDYYWLYGIIWSLVYVGFLVWQLPWAVITLRDMRWGTR